MRSTNKATIVCSASLSSEASMSAMFERRRPRRTTASVMRGSRYAGELGLSVESVNSRTQLGSFWRDLVELLFRLFERGTATTEKCHCPLARGSILSRRPHCRRPIESRRRRRGRRNENPSFSYGDNERSLMRFSRRDRMRVSSRTPPIVSKKNTAAKAPTT
jgi:hypothetical protein